MIVLLLVEIIGFLVRQQVPTIPSNLVMNDCITPGEGGHTVHGMVSLPCEPDGIFLNDEIVRQQSTLAVVVELVVRSHGGDRRLKWTLR